MQLHYYKLLLLISLQHWMLYTKKNKIIKLSGRYYLHTARNFNFRRCKKINKTNIRNIQTERNKNTKLFCWQITSCSLFKFFVCDCNTQVITHLHCKNMMYLSTTDANLIRIAMATFAPNCDTMRCACRMINIKNAQQITGGAFLANSMLLFTANRHQARFCNEKSIFTE